MSQYYVPDSEDYLECPYDKTHMVRAKRFQYHLMKCRHVSSLGVTDPIILFHFLLIKGEGICSVLTSIEYYLGQKKNVLFPVTCLKYLGSVGGQKNRL